MVNFSGKDYKLYYLDTCALSEMVKDRPGFGSNLLNLVLEDGYIAISPHSLWELKSVPNIYNDVLEVLTSLPTILLKTESNLFGDEYDNLTKTKSVISPISAYMLKTKDNIDILDIIDLNITNIKNAHLRQERDNTFKILARLPSNIYSREDLKSPAIIEKSVDLDSFQLAAHYKLQDIQAYIESHSEAFPMKEFPSLLAISYIKHYKFLQSERKGSKSDITDILMAAVYPYVDVVITESHQCEMIKQIKKRHAFLSDLKPISMREVRTENYSPNE